MPKRPAAAAAAPPVQAFPVRRRLRGKQAVADYEARPYGPPVPASRRSVRGTWPNEACLGRAPGQPCVFAADGSGRPAYGRHNGRCALCGQAALENALRTPTGRSNLLRSLKHWRRAAPDLFAAAFAQSALTELDAAAREKLRTDASVPSYAEALEWRMSVAASPSAQELLEYRTGVEQDKAYVQRKFFPKKVRIVRHAGFRWQNPMPEELARQVQDIAVNDTGLPKASTTAAARAMECWCKHGSWDLCRQCGSAQLRHLKEASVKQAARGNLVLCKNCSKPENKRVWVPTPEEVPAALRGLSRAEVESLRPLDIDCGPEWKAEFGYYFHGSMIRFSWAAEDVEDKIDALERKSKKRVKKAQQPENRRHRSGNSFFSRNLQMFLSLSGLQVLGGERGVQLLRVDTSPPQVSECQPKRLGREAQTSSSVSRRKRH